MRRRRRARAPRRDDVAELDLAPLAVDLDRQREADEAPVLVDAANASRVPSSGPPRSGRATRARSPARRDGQAREAQDVGVVEQPGDVVEVLLGQRPQRDASTVSGRGAASR
jgi:hypothetical protein